MSDLAEWLRAQILERKKTAEGGGAGTVKRHLRLLRLALVDILSPQILVRSWPPGVRLEDVKRREEHRTEPDRSAGVHQHRWFHVNLYEAEDGIDPQWGRKRVECKGCGEQRLVYRLLALDAIW